MDFTPITTQEQFDAAIKDRLNRERDSFAKKYEGYVSPDDLTKVKNEYAKQIADLTKDAEAKAKKYADYDKKIADRDAKIKGYETDSVKTRIAHETGLPYELAGRLSGSTEEEIRKDAESLVKLVGSTQTKTAPMADPEGVDAGGKGSSSALLALSRSLKGE